VSEPLDWRQGHASALIVTTAAGLEADARRELRRLLPDAAFHSLPLKGNLLALTSLPEAEAAGAIAAGPTTCVARAIPVQARARVGPSAACFAAVAAAAAELGRLRPGDTFIVRCERRGRHEWRSRELERAVALRLEAATSAVGDYEAEVDWHVTIQVYQEIAYLGINHPSHLVHKPLQRQRKYRPGERPLNRAQWKLREALSAFGITLPACARALDLGSAPGGWALVLAELGAAVTAVDPADLAPEAAAHPRLEHLRCRAEDLAGRADLHEAYDLLACDMNVDPAEAAQALALLAPLLKPGAPAIMTIKYMTPDRRRHEREARAILSRQYQDIHLQRLPHNARETTAAMRRRPPPERTDPARRGIHG